MNQDYRRYFIGVDKDLIDCICYDCKGRQERISVPEGATILAISHFRGVIEYCFSNRMEMFGNMQLDKECFDSLIAFCEANFSKIEHKNYDGFKERSVFNP